MFQIATCGKRIGLRVLDQIKLRHRESCRNGKILKYAIQLRMRFHLNRLGMMHGKHNLIREPIADHIHDNTENNRDIKNRLVIKHLRKHPADRNHDAKKQRHQKPCFLDIG